MERLTDDQLIAALNFDPLGEVHDATGAHHSHPVLGDAVTALSIPLFHEKAELCRRELAARGDTWRGMPLEDYLAAVTAEGFEQVLAEPIVRELGGYRNTYFIYAHRDGMLLVFDSYGEAGDRLNGNSRLFTLWRGVERSLKLYGGSGGFKDGVYDRYFYVDEALRLRIALLRQHGELVSPWPHQPFLHLVTHEESRVKGYDYRAITAARVSRLPDWVRAFMGVPA